MIPSITISPEQLIAVVLQMASPFLAVFLLGLATLIALAFFAPTERVAPAPQRSPDLRPARIRMGREPVLAAVSGAFLRADQESSPRIAGAR